MHLFVANTDVKLKDMVMLVKISVVSPEFLVGMKFLLLCQNLSIGEIPPALP